VALFPGSAGARASPSEKPTSREKRPPPAFPPEEARFSAEDPRIGASPREVPASRRFTRGIPREAPVLDGEKRQGGIKEAPGKEKRELRDGKGSRALRPRIARLYNGSI
jgi:hypothetical protein